MAWLHARLFVLLVAALLPAESCRAQGNLVAPTDTELQAAYCLGFVQARGDDLVPTIRGTERFLSSAPPELRQDAQQALEALRDVEKGLIDNLKRLQAYLLPRVGQVNSASILAARTRGEADHRSLADSKVLANCQTACGSNSLSCLDSCLLRDPLHRRVRACRDLDFLPF